MTTKKSKQYDLKNKAEKDFKNKPKEFKKKNQNNKRLDTFLPIPNEENTQKLTNQK